MSFSSVSFGISFEHTVQLPFTVFLYCPFPDNYAFLSLSPSQIKNIQSADTVPVHGHSPLVGSSDHVQPDSTEPASIAQPVNTAFQSDPSQKSDKPKSPCMAPRASTIKEQGFSEAVAARIEAPQRGSTRSVYEAKWTIFTKWCVINQVDFRAPPVKSVADFLIYLFQDRKLQPSTIDGYRSAIADKPGNLPVNKNLTRLLDSFHRDRPKGRRVIPSWNLPGFTPIDKGSI